MDWPAYSLSQRTQSLLSGIQLATIRSTSKASSGRVRYCLALVGTCGPGWGRPSICCGKDKATCNEKSTKFVWRQLFFPVSVPETEGLRRPGIVATDGGRWRRRAWSFSGSPVRRDGAVSPRRRPNRRKSRAYSARDPTGGTASRSTAASRWSRWRGARRRSAAGATRTRRAG